MTLAPSPNNDPKQEGPGPGDTVIGLTVGCHTRSPGLDTKRDRVVRISFRFPPKPPKPGDKPPKKPPPPPPPAPPKKPKPPPDGPGGLIDPVTGKPRPGGIIVVDGITYVDTVVAGQPDSEPGKGGGDDSEDIASRIADNIQAGVDSGDIPEDAVGVEHNGYSDCTEGGDAPDKRGKPIDPGDKKGRGTGGAGRIILHGATHVDAASDYGKITLYIMLWDDSTTGQYALDLLPTVPSQIPNYRQDSEHRRAWRTTDYVEPPDEIWRGRGTGDPNDYQMRQFVRKIPWKQPRKAPRRFAMHFSRDLMRKEWTDPDEPRRLVVGVFVGTDARVATVPIANSAGMLLSAMVRIFSRLGRSARMTGDKSLVVAGRQSSSVHASGIMIGFSNTGWRLAVDRRGPLRESALPVFPRPVATTNSKIGAGSYVAHMESQQVARVLSNARIWGVVR